MDGLLDVLSVKVYGALGLRKGPPSIANRITSNCESRNDRYSRTPKHIPKNWILEISVVHLGD